MIDLDVRRNFFAGHGTGRDGTGRDSSSKSAAGRDGTKLDLAGHGTGRDCNEFGTMFFVSLLTNG
jgi:hypothetical protein